MRDLSVLANLPADLADTLAVLDGVDTCFHVGFSRMTPEQAESLSALSRIFSGTPLEAGLKKAVEDLRAGVFLPEHMDSLAAARCALMGASYDALMDQGAQAVGKPLVTGGGSATFTPATGSAATWLSGVRDLLGKLVITGFSWLDEAQVATLEPTLERLQDEPPLFRLAALMTGFYQELARALPIQSEQVPVRRWSDLWARAMLMTRGIPTALTTQVSGTFAPLGVELRQHANNVSMLVHGVLESEGTKKLVRTTVSAWRCEVLAGPDVWRLVKTRENQKLPANDVLIEAVGAQKTIAIKNMALTESGDLLWSGEAALGAAWDVFAQDWGSDISRLPAVDRHPVQVSLPILVDGGATEEAGYLAMAGVRVATTADGAAPITPALLKTASRTVAMLKWNGQWYLQPLAVETRSGKKVVVTHNGQYGASVKLKEDRFQMLQYKASKLLRKKS